MSNIYQIVTEQVIEQLEQGVAPWRKPWSSALPCNLLSQKPYRGMNVFFLATQGFESKYWLTFNQCANLGGRIKPGSKSTFVIAGDSDQSLYPIRLRLFIRIGSCK
jgi:antirestriction protein ArdC